MKLLKGKYAPRGGDVGDYFYDEQTAEMYGPKTQDGWPTNSVNIKGPQFRKPPEQNLSGYAWSRLIVPIAGAAVLCGAAASIDPLMAQLIPVGIALYIAFGD